MALAKKNLVKETIQVCDVEIKIGWKLCYLLNS